MLLKQSELIAAAQRLWPQRATVANYAAPGSIEEQRSAGEAAGRRWVLELAGYAEILDLMDAGRAGTTSFAAGFNTAALETAQALIAMPIPEPVQESETPPPELAPEVSDQPAEPVQEESETPVVE